MTQSKSAPASAAQPVVALSRLPGVVVAAALVPIAVRSTATVAFVAGAGRIFLESRVVVDETRRSNGRREALWVAATRIMSACVCAHKRVRTIFAGLT
jgi:hypothetical protein